MHMARGLSFRRRSRRVTGKQISSPVLVSGDALLRTDLIPIRQHDDSNTLDSTAKSNCSTHMSLKPAAETPKKQQLRHQDRYSTPNLRLHFDDEKGNNDDDDLNSSRDRLISWVCRDDACYEGGDGHRASPTPAPTPGEKTIQRKPSIWKRLRLGELFKGKQTNTPEREIISESRHDGHDQSTPGPSLPTSPKIHTPTSNKLFSSITSRTLEKRRHKRDGLIISDLPYSRPSAFIVDDVESPQPSAQVGDGHEYEHRNAYEIDNTSESLLHVDIPKAEMERYSVMFSGVLDSKRQSSLQAQSQSQSQSRRYPFPGKESFPEVDEYPEDEVCPLHFVHYSHL